MPLLDRIELNLLMQDKTVIVRTDMEEMTGRELEMLSNGLGHRLSNLVQPRDGKRVPIAVVGHKNPRMLAGFLAAMKAGSPYIPIDETLMPPSRIDQILSLSKAWRVQAAHIRQQSDVMVKPSIEDETRPAYIIFTSGSTGVPKGVVVPIEAIESFVSGMIERHNLRPGEVWLNVAPWSFDLSVLETYVVLYLGGRLESLSRNELTDPNRLFDRLVETPIDNWVSTPSFVDVCLTERSFDQSMIPTLKRFFFCGEVLHAKTVLKLLDRFPNATVYNLYGPTEACCAVTSIEIDRKLAVKGDPLPVGYPLDGVVIAIDNPESGVPTRPSERGEVILMGKQVALGYFESDGFGQGVAASQGRFKTTHKQRQFRTGDWGRIIDGCLFVEGRMDRQVKVAGNRVELGEVELAIITLAGVEDVVCMQTPKGSLRAFIRGDIDPIQVRYELRQKVPAYMIPRAIIVRTEFPLNDNGKIDLTRLEMSE